MKYSSYGHSLSIYQMSFLNEPPPYLFFHIFKGRRWYNWKTHQEDIRLGVGKWSQSVVIFLALMRNQQRKVTTFLRLQMHKAKMNIIKKSFGRIAVLTHKGGGGGLLSTAKVFFKISPQKFELWMSCSVDHCNRFINWCLECWPFVWENKTG